MAKHCSCVDSSVFWFAINLTNLRPEASMSCIHTSTIDTNTTPCRLPPSNLWIPLALASTVFWVKECWSVHVNPEPTRDPIILVFSIRFWLLSSRHFHSTQLSSPGILKTHPITTEYLSTSGTRLFSSVGFGNARIPRSFTGCFVVRNIQVWFDVHGIILVSCSEEESKLQFLHTCSLFPQTFISIAYEYVSSSDRFPKTLFHGTFTFSHISSSTICFDYSLVSVRRFICTLKAFTQLFLYYICLLHFHYQFQPFANLIQTATGIASPYTCHTLCTHSARTTFRCIIINTYFLESSYKRHCSSDGLLHCVGKHFLGNFILIKHSQL
jgi:hypothetical protein